MRPAQILGPAILLAGLVTLAIAVARGEASVYLILVIPAVVGNGPIALLGILLVFLGFFLTFFLSFARMGPIPTESVEAPAVAPPEAAPVRRWGGVVFLGPIPIVFGSDARMTRMMLVLGAILFLGLVALTLAFLFA